MPGPTIKPLHLTSRMVARAIGWLVLAGASASAAGWIAGMSQLTDPLGYGISIKLNAAICLALISVALLAASYFPAYRIPVWVLGGSAVIIGLITLAEYLTTTDLGIDTLLAGEPPGTSAPGRMGVPASV